MAAVLAETYRQLSRSGLAGVSIDEVSRVSGVSKTTIYRHWPSRASLLIDACSRLGGLHNVPDTGRLQEDLFILISSLADQLQTASWSSVYPSIIDAAERDPEISAMQAKWHEGLLAPFHTVIERARNRREIGVECSASDMIAGLLGPLFYKRWFSKEAIDRDFLSRTILAVARDAAPRP